MAGAFSGARSFLHQALAFAFAIDHHQFHFLIHLAFAIPVAAGRTDLDLGGEYQLVSHFSSRFLTHVALDKNPCHYGG